jgi:hypothetical protein
MPFEHFLGRLCEEFKCLPSAAFREWMTAPSDLLETIIQFRAYAQAKNMYDTAKSKRDIPQSPMIDLVRAIDFDLALEEISQSSEE